MKAKVKTYAIETGKPIVVVNEEDMKDLGIHLSDRVKLSYQGHVVTCIVDATTSLVKVGEVGLFEDVKNLLKVEEGYLVDIHVAQQPKSIDYIRKKISGMELSKEEIVAIVHDVVENNLSDIELAGFITAAYIHGYTMDETVALTNAMVETGSKIDFGENVVDKHCIGGVAGNRTTLLITPIMAAFGLTMPKTSSRAITSPAGTADTMEVFSPVEFKIPEIKEIVKKVGACIIWGGAVNLAPADDKIIRVEYPLSLDPEGQVLASVMAKKKSVGSDYVIIDIPLGKGAKIQQREKAESLAHKFIELGKRLNIAVECVITDGSSPIGRGIGPALEARDVLLALNNKGPQDLINKSLDLAGKLLELSCGLSDGKGREIAEDLLTSGKALEKFREIIQAQGGEPDLEPEDIPVGDHTYVVHSKIQGNVRHIDNKRISRVARAAGAPKDKGSGVFLHIGVGELVEKDQPLYTIYAEHKEKLDDAVKLAQHLVPVEVGGLILEEIS